MAKEAPQQEEKIAINRREFLNIAWLASLGFFAVNMAGVGFLFAMPRFKEGELGGAITVGKAADLPLPADPNTLIRVDTGRRINGKPHA